MVLPTVMFYFGGVHLSLDILRACGFKAPFRISSTPTGSPMPTALYVLIEDVIAVDGGGGQVYRYALRTRYLSSPYFRRMLFEMNCFWGGGSVVFAAAITAIVFTVPESVAFTVSSPACSPHPLSSASLLTMASWAGPSRSLGPPSGPASPSPGSRAISVARRKPGAKVASRAAFPLPMTSLRQQPVRASVLSRRTIHIFSPGPGRNKKPRHRGRRRRRRCSQAEPYPYIPACLLTSLLYSIISSCCQNKPLDAGYDRIVAYLPSYTHARTQRTLLPFAFSWQCS